MRFVKRLANYIKCWHVFLTLNHICPNIDCNPNVQSNKKKKKLFKSSLKSYVCKTFIYILEKINLLKSMGILHFDSMGLIKILLGDLSGANDFFFFFKKYYFTTVEKIIIYQFMVQLIERNCNLWVFKIHIFTLDSGLVYYGYFTQKK